MTLFNKAVLPALIAQSLLALACSGNAWAQASEEDCEGLGGTPPGLYSSYLVGQGGNPMNEYSCRYSILSFRPRGGGGCQHYREEDRVAHYILPRATYVVSSISTTTTPNLAVLTSTPTVAHAAGSTVEVLPTTLLRAIRAAGVNLTTITAEKDTGMRSLAECWAPVCCIVGKTWL